jgi:hypothetical protein
LGVKVNDPLWDFAIVLELGRARGPLIADHAGSAKFHLQWQAVQSVVGTFGAK